MCTADIAQAIANNIYLRAFIENSQGFASARGSRASSIEFAATCHHRSIA